jgi:hypothetical protein
VKLFRRGPTGEGYGNIYTPHAGSMIIQVQRENGLANRTIVLTQGQVKLLKSLATRKWLVVGAIFFATWAWLVVDRARELVASRDNSAVAERMRVDSLARQLGELQERYDQVSRMLGSTPGTATSVPAVVQAPVDAQSQTVSHPTGAQKLP